LDFAREPVRWQPLGHRIRIQKSTVDPIWGCADHPMELDGMGWHDGLSVEGKGLYFAAFDA
jgi:hypothetical protein